MALDDREETELTGGGDTQLHYHLADRVTNAQLASALREVIVSSNYTLRKNDDIVKVTASCNITLPKMTAQREVQVIQYFSGGSVVVYPSGTDTIMGTTSLTMTTMYSSAHLKGLDGDWVLI